MMHIQFLGFRKKFRTASIAIAAAVALGIGLAGCGSSQPSTSASTSKTSSGNVVWWTWTGTPAVNNEYIAAFKKAFPKIHVTLKFVQEADSDAALRPALVSGSGPDVFQITAGYRVPEFATFALNMTPAIEKALGSNWKSKIAPLGVGPLTTGGKLVALSDGSVSAGSVWINRDLFTKYNLTPPKTVSEWVKDCSVFKAAGVTCFVQGAGSASGPWVRDDIQALANSISPNAWSAAAKGTGKWTAPAIVKALTVWKSLFGNGIMQPGALGIQQEPDAQTIFSQGKAAMVAMGTWEAQFTTTSGMKAGMASAGVANPKPFAIVPIPFPAASGSGGTKFTLFGNSDSALAVNAKSKNVGAATTFAVWLATSKTAQQIVADQLDDVPSLKSVTPNWSAITMPDKSAQLGPVQDLMSQGANVTQDRNALLSAQVLAAIGAAGSSVAAGESTPQQAAQSIQQAADQSGGTSK